MINQYSFREVLPRVWKIGPLHFGDINLIVGPSGVGKSRLLNTISSLSKMIKKEMPPVPGEWIIALDINGHNYKWTVLFEKINGLPQPVVKKESLMRGSEKLIDRTKKIFLFGSHKLPKLDTHLSAVSLLRDEKSISPVSQAIERVTLRRLEITERPLHIQPIPKLSSEELSNLDFVARQPSLNLQLWILQEYHRNIFKRIKTEYQEIFPFVSQIDIKELSDLKNFSIQFLAETPKEVIPITCIQERNVKGPISIFEMSSGMKRALEQLVDLYTLPKGSTLLIDEHENGLGLTALNRLTDIFLRNRSGIQVIMTTHHPYIINNIPEQYWHILTRRGGRVKVKKTSDIPGFDKSSQEKFIKLINSPFYSEVEK